MPACGASNRSGSARPASRSGCSAGAGRRWSASSRWAFRRSRTKNTNTRICRLCRKSNFSMRRPRRIRARPAYRGLGGFTLRFDSGRLAAADGEVPQGVSVRSIAERLRNDPDGLESLLGACAAFEDHALAARNTACFEDGAVIEVAPGAVVEEPIHLVFAAASAVSNARVLIAAGRNSQVRVIESYIGAGKYWTNAVTEVYAGENAVVEHYRAQLESARGFPHRLLSGRSGTREQSLDVFAELRGGRRPQRHQHAAQRRRMRVRARRPVCGQGRAACRSSHGDRPRHAALQLAPTL